MTTCSYNIGVLQICFFFCSSILCDRNILYIDMNMRIYYESCIIKRCLFTGLKYIAIQRWRKYSSIHYTCTHIKNFQSNIFQRWMEVCAKQWAYYWNWYIGQNRTEHTHSWLFIDSRRLCNWNKTIFRSIVHIRGTVCACVCCVFLFFVVVCG